MTDRIGDWLATSEGGALTEDEEAQFADRLHQLIDAFEAALTRSKTIVPLGNLRLLRLMRDTTDYGNANGAADERSAAKIEESTAIFLAYAAASDDALRRAAARGTVDLRDPPQAQDAGLKG